MLNLFWADEAGLPANDRGLAYGDGLFETIRMEGRQGVLLSRHINRLVRDAARLGITVSGSELKSVCARAADRLSGGFDGAGWILKLTLTRGGGGRGYRPDSAMVPNLMVSGTSPPPQTDPAGVVADFSRVPLTVNPLFAGIKSLNRLEQVMAARELDDRLFEVIMSNSAGHLVEGTRTNLLVKVRDRWVTPPGASLAVAGIMREWVLERLRERGEHVEERPLTTDDILGPDCRGLFLLNSVLGVVPVRTLADHDLPVETGLATIFNPFELLE
ncbi:aminotransferase class IV [Marinobacter sp. F4218]|uniref:aminotransferase class IV n=1 Tax=Marinobacter sp. F4218 TaxID=2862868 RepID=UPI001C62F1B6|nr:aminotransferase class IV [Marinobacter sp. F4218]MBW7470263.1 aminotransferase class IV [Marinobacter sp. F4218]